MPHIEIYLQNLWDISLEMAPWLMLGLLAAGLMKALLPMSLVGRWLGGSGLRPIINAAVLGAPLPLCSCSVLPAAVSLRRQGASPGATAAFLISTPETSVDSVAVSYALLGPFLTIARPIAAVISAVFVGLLTGLAPISKSDATQGDTASCCHGASEQSDGKSNANGIATEDANTRSPLGRRLLDGMHYAITSLLDDLAKWIVIGLLLAAAVETIFDPGQLAQWGSGLPAMLVMVAVGVPMYVCATASTPLAAGLLAAGVSPGTVLVFLLAGPATNIATFGVLRRELGVAATVIYLLSLAVISIACGLTTDWLVGTRQIDVPAQIAHSHEIVPAWLSVACIIVLVLLAVRPLRRLVIRS